MTKGDKKSLGKTSGSDQLTAADRWVIFEAMISQLGLVRQHLNSFDDFLENQLNAVVKEVDKIVPDIEGYYVKLLGIETGTPSIREADGSERPIYPSEARIRNLIYSVPLYLLMKPIFVEDGLEREDKQVKAYIGRLPLMLKSKKCALSKKTPEELIELGEDPEDPGGYFIINGSERVIVTQEYLVSNRVLVDYGRKGGPVGASAKIFSTIAGFRSLVTVEHRSDRRLTVNFFSVPRPLPFGVLMKALGIESDADIAGLITDDEEILLELTPTLLQSNEIADQQEALDFIGKRVAVGQTQQYRILRARHVLDHYLLPHIGTSENDRYAKALFLANMALRVMELELYDKTPDDKDHYANKRLKLAGEMLTSLFRVAFRSLYRDIKYQLEKNAKRGKTPNLKVAMRADVITERVRHALATGNWVGGKAGVSQLLDRTNYMSTYSNLRRVISPLIRSQAHFEARDLHATHWGKICVSPDTLVLLGDGVTQTAIDNLEANYAHMSVTTVDETTHQQLSSKILAYQRVSAQALGKQVLAIKTITGRNILATEDHPFLTKRGWVEAGQLTLTDKVLIRPTIIPINEQEGQNNPVFTILDTDMYLKGSWIEKLPENEKYLLQEDVQELELLGLLPLESDNQKLPIVSRLLGLILTDGSTTNTVEFYLGTEDDAKAIGNDLQALGFEPSPISKKESIFNPDDQVEPVLYQTYMTTKGGVFKRFVMALGVPTGKRSEQSVPFPDWILNCSKLVKREFLAAFMGGDGAAPWGYKRTEDNRKESYKIRLPDLEIHKHKDYANTQILFFEKLVTLFKEFNITTINIKSRTLGENDRVAVDLVFEASKENIANLCKTIGYRYSQEKQFKAQLVGEYLNYHQEEITKRAHDRKTIINLYNQGKQPKEISQELNIGYRIVTSIIERRQEESQVVLPKSAYTINQFFEETNADMETGMLYVPLSSIEATNEDIVCDFTTQENTHSFVANGFVTHNCPNETPEGPNCGLVKNLALQAYISTGVDEQEIVNTLFAMFPLTKVEKGPIDHKALKLFVNGKFIATTREKGLHEQIRSARRANKISSEINITFYPDDNQISINTDGGRVRRPLIIVKDGKSLLRKEHIERLRRGERTFIELLEKDGVLEFLDAEEEENALIALNVDDLTTEHTHLEIAAAAILGISTSVIPFPDHNQSPRNTYEAGMIKQALGLYASNFKYRADRRAHILQNPQIPLVGNKPMDLIGFNKRPAGQNPIVGVISFQGWNIQDAIVFNQASIQRGLFRSHFFRSYVAEEKKYMGGQEDKFEIPTKGVRGFRAQEVYRHISEFDGIIEPEIEVKGGDVLVGRTSRPRFLEEYIELERPEPQRRETSISMRHGEEGVVDSVVVTETNEGNKLVKVKIRDQRIPELGDKFASRHGQKGVIGAIINTVDMPFTENGITPDIIINPHAIPNRMTIGQVLECMAAIIAAQTGKQFDATIFEAPTPEEISQMLLKLGFHPYAETVMYDGITGEKMPSRIFIGPTYYQKLHHLVADKIHARARGPVQILTRQPTEGRAREGGLRFGEMERDCIIGHGAALLLKERLLDESDKIEIYICEQCGLIADHNVRTGQTSCKVCGAKDTNISKIAVSYAFKLLLQELQSMLIKPSLILETTS